MTNWLQKKNINVLTWPSSSPDINPIENLWAIVKNKVNKRKPKNLKELKDIFIEEWKNIPLQVLQNLVSSMESRCEKIIDVHGDRIRM